ncbi:MAG: trypsin-like serine protease [Acidobacteriota bacterium]|jgi:hypothetical protein
MRGHLLASLLLLASVPPAGAIVIRHDRDDADYRALGAEYPAVAKILPDGEGTLIAPRWVLTAAHVGRDVRRVGGTVRVGEREYAVGGVFLHPDWKGQEHDIALVRLQEPVSGVQPASLYRNRDELGKVVTFVGRGDFGTGKEGILRADGALRAATNRVDRTTDDWLIFTFDPPQAATRLEGISGPGDSGGPALVRRDGRSWVLGVSSGGQSPEGGRPGMYGSREFYTRVSTHLDWIDSVLEDAAR